MKTYLDIWMICLETQRLHWRHRGTLLLLLKNKIFSHVARDIISSFYLISNNASYGSCSLIKI
jgi:hypothetical protein